MCTSNYFQHAEVSPTCHFICNSAAILLAQVRVGCKRSLRWNGRVLLQDVSGLNVHRLPAVRATKSRNMTYTRAQNISRCMSGSGDGKSLHSTMYRFTGSMTIRTVGVGPGGASLAIWGHPASKTQRPLQHRNQAKWIRGTWERARAGEVSLASIGPLRLLTRPSPWFVPGRDGKNRGRSSS